MEQVVLVIHLILALGIIVLVLLQRSEGGGLGIGGGGGMGGLATPGGTASAMTKVTAVFAFCFFGTSLLLGILAGTHSKSTSILDELDAPQDLEIKVLDEDEVEDVINSLPAEERPSVPVE